MDYRYVKSFEFNFNFGTLLSVDFSSCCKKEEIDLFSLTEEIFNEIKDCVKIRGIPNLIWFKGFSEHIKYTNFQQITEMIREVYPNQKIGIYLNCGIFQDEKARNEFHACDLVAINLNTVDHMNFSRINKCPESIEPFRVLEGIVEFSKDFQGNLGIYTMFLRSINDTLDDVIKLKEFLKDVKPDYYSISNYTLDGFKPISDEFKAKLKELLGDLPFKVIFSF